MDNQTDNKKGSIVKDNVVDKMSSISSWLVWLDNRLSWSNIAIFSTILTVVLSTHVAIIIENIELINFKSRENTLFAFSLIFIILYGGIFFASMGYDIMLRGKYDYKKLLTNRDDLIPKFFSVWILPIISILLVMVSQIIALGGEEGASVDIAYTLAFTFSTALILLMIGMELSYCAQEHKKDHRWLVLITVSLILDFASYVILIAGFEAPKLNTQVPNEDDIPVGKSLFVFLLGIWSGISSYFTITKARLTDEVLELRHSSSKSQVKGDM